MLGPLLESWEWIKAHNPRSLFKKKHRLNFITIHYLYILFITIVGSILLYPAGGLAYIDALFFASGSATQSGLNTVNINDLNTYQQLVFYFLGMICTPIFINTFVVFVRLYWFERRFQNVVREARNFRRTRSRTRTELKDDADPSCTEKGVRGRSIVVLHNGNALRQRREMSDQTEKPDLAEDLGSESSSSERGRTEAVDHAITLPPLNPPTFRRDVTFADEVESPEANEAAPQMLPQRLSPEQHIAILENQRNPKDKGALRIPGPRDFDRGSVPEPLDLDDDGGQIDHQVTSPVERRGMLNGTSMKRNVTIDEPHHPRERANSAAYPKLSSRKSGTLENLKMSPTDEVALPSGRTKGRTGTFSSLKGWASKENEPATPYLSWQPTIGRNSAFVDLTEDQREELGGIEYRSLKTLTVVLVSYYLTFHLLGVVILLPWIVRSSTWGPVVDGDGQSRVWWGIFTPASMFNDLGFTLTADSMESFQTAIVPLLLGAFLIVIGNTGFPCMLRLVIYIASKLVPRESGVWEELKFLLDHPRRCFTLLFPNSATWWLFWILVILNGLDIIFFIVLDLHDSVLTSINPAGYRVLNGLFQAASTRTAGFASVDLANLHPGIQVSYLIMMYISVFPIAISVRRTNVYEEKSLGIYGSSKEETDDEKEPSYVGAHLRRQLSFDLWYIFLGLFIIAIAEGDRLSSTNDYAFTLFSVLFEIVSAYGTVGLSLGYPGIDASFSAEFSVVSKLVVIAMQIRGRHRGLPYELDRAVLLPSDSLHKKEDEDAAKRVQRRNSSISNLEPMGRTLSSRTPTVGPVSGSTWPAMAAPDTAAASGRDEDGMNGTNSSLEQHPNHSGHAQKGLGKLMAGLAEGPRIRARE
ncbi:hypothetical protein HO133_005496 [Letharia lupina]|uniref:Potassium transport protein n=1 Tax=Letharia lupina TaxID=560253 RepID=A0A8H6C8P1_9LECA|nr:uncharacterized protein HO133_005496 [Letharia lupina]KAF6218952.1 hypothetical protein HO133_005496 [Letharia lupina]